MTTTGLRLLLVVFLGMCLSLSGAAAEKRYPWLSSSSAGATATLEQRILPPAGFVRRPMAGQGFGAWLRGLPVKPVGAPILYYDGTAKAHQGWHAAVIDIDVGRRDLQQCADAVMRLRAEYLRVSGLGDTIRFDATNGDVLDLARWQKGLRPKLVKGHFRWPARRKPSRSYKSFQAYLRFVFAYAGSYSLQQELKKVSDPMTVRSGDVFIQGGFPGHAVIVVDVAERAAGADPAIGGGGKVEKVIMLAQSFMPAQDMHIVHNLLDHRLSPWYPVDPAQLIATPEWTFSWDDLHRF